MSNQSLSIASVVESLLLLQDQGEVSTLLGIGPMSHNCVRASLEVAKENDCPVMFIASRNQVDLDSLGGGYANNWNQFSFASDVADIAAELSFDGFYYLCRDHGGPWQRDEERAAQLSKPEAMSIAKTSFTADIEAGFDLIMVDPTKSPYTVDGVVPLDDVVEMTIELIAFCESERIRLNTQALSYEVGTEETSGGLTTSAAYAEFIERLSVDLKERDLPLPSFIVGQTGTLVRKTHNAGSFDLATATELATTARKAGLGLKEHNADYLDSDALLLHLAAGVTASNVAPQYGTAETLALLELDSLEKTLQANGFIKSPSEIGALLKKEAIATGRWRKWMTGDQKELSEDEVAHNAELSHEVVRIAGHYTLNQPHVLAAIEKLYANLQASHIEGERFVIDSIKRPMQHYVDCFNLRGLTTRIKKATGQ